MSPTELELLRLVHASPGLKNAEYAKTMNPAPSNVGGLVKSLRDQGYLEPAVHPQDVNYGKAFPTAKPVPGSPTQRIQAIGTAGNPKAGSAESKARAERRAITVAARKIRTADSRRPPAAGEGPRRPARTDCTLPPVLITAMSQAAAAVGIGRIEWLRLAIESYALELAERPIAPRPLVCDACGRRYAVPRSQGEHRRLAVAMDLDPAKGGHAEWMHWMADTFFHGTWSQALEAAVRFYLGDEAPQLKMYGGQA